MGAHPHLDPAHTLDAAITKKQEVLRNEPLAAIGIGMFGPVDLNPASSITAHHDHAQAGLGVHRCGRASAKRFPTCRSASTRT